MARNKSIKRVFMISPFISLLFHSIILFILSLIVVSKSIKRESSIEVSLQPVAVKAPQPKLELELNDQDKLIDVEVPPIPIPPDPVVEEIKINPVEIESELIPPENLPPTIPRSPIVTTSRLPKILSIKLPSSIILGGRNPLNRRAKVKQHGGSEEAQKAVLKALRWLKKNQNENGSWGDKNPAAYTGLALLCFLAYGADPKDNEFGETVKKGIIWLAEGMRKHRMLEREYGHAMATYALAEALTMTQSPLLYEPVEKATQIILNGQQKEGGFDYGYGKGDRWDLSVTGWQIQALKAVYIAGSKSKSVKAALDKSTQWLKSVPYKNGLFGYAEPPKIIRPGMLGVGALCLQLLGLADTTEVRETCRNIIKHALPLYEWKNVERNYFALYSWYYQTQAMFNHQTSDFSGWKKWQRHFEKVLVKAQKQDGSWAPRKTKWIKDEDHKNKGYNKLVPADKDRKIYSTVPSLVCNWKSTIVIYPLLALIK